VGVLGVLLFHAGHLRGGWLGVDLFFVLSGFLITSLLVAEFEARGRISIASFWARRARRLLPALFAALLGVAAYAATLARPEELARIRGDGLATLFYVANWHALYAGHDYWQLFSTPSPLDHTWSLAIEEQLYLFWPPLAYVVLRLSRRSTRPLAWVSALLGILAAVWMAVVFDPRAGTARVYFGTDTRAAATLVGAALAAALRGPVKRWPSVSTPYADAAALVGAGLLGAAWLHLDGSDPLVYRGGLFALALSAVTLIGGIILAPRGVASRILGLAPLRWLGLVSYGLYLWHWPVYLVLTPERMGTEGWALTIIRITASLGVAIASYLLLERPIRRGVLPKGWAGPLAIGGSALVAAAVVAATGPLPSAPPSGSGSDSLVETSLDVLLVGDSVAQTLGPELQLEAQKRGLRARALGRFGCTVLRSERLWFSEFENRTLDLTGCNGVRGRWHRSIAAAKPRFVLILEGWVGGGAREVAGIARHPCEPEYDLAYASDLADAVNAYAALGASAVIVTTPPPSFADLRPSFTGLWPGVPEDELDARFRTRMQCQNRVRHQVAAATEARIADLADYVCPGGRCRRELDGQLLRSDGIHFRDTGARMVAGWLLDEIAVSTP
jgi:peptidoglycan/LPS O-acetylase OafA/YrhL